MKKTAAVFVCKPHYRVRALRGVGRPRSYGIFAPGHAAVRRDPAEAVHVGLSLSISLGLGLGGLALGSLGLAFPFADLYPPRVHLLSLLNVVILFVTVVFIAVVDVV